MSQEEERIRYYLSIIDKNLPPSQWVDSGAVEDYYRQALWAYRAFHSREGAIHMAINPSGVFDPKGYLGQARRVAEYIKPNSKVLELGAGVGFNTQFLATEISDSQFVASDKASSQVKRLQEAFRGSKNVSAETIDYENIALKESFDLIFMVETFCYASDREAVLREIARILKPGGRLLIFDGWLGASSLPGIFERASYLAMKSMVIDSGISLHDFLLQASNFSLLKAEDLTRDIDPSLQRLHDLSWRYLRRPRLVSWSKKLAPMAAQNSVAGILMPDLFSSGSWQYQMVALEKK